MITKWTKTLIKKSSLVMQNNFVFYFVLLIAVLNIAQFCYMNDAKSIGVFIVTGFIVSFFSKNNTVIILISMIIANMFSGVSREGFKKVKKPKGKKTKTSDGNADAAAENKEAEEEKKEEAAEIKEAASEKKQEMRESQVGTALDMIDRLKEKLDELSKA